MLKNVAIAAALGVASPAVASEAPPEPVRIGIIDARADQLTFDDHNTQIQYREFAPEGMRSARRNTEEGFDQGQAVASAFVRQIRKIDANAPIEIFAANPMYERENHRRLSALSGNGGATTAINADGAVQALGWFKQNNVRIVVTTMSGRDTPATRRFMAEADRLGMVVFASAGNASEAGRPFPAAYPQAVSVAADNHGLALSRNPDLANWVSFSMDGGVPKGLDGDRVSASSSFAVAKAAAFASYAEAQGQEVTRDNVMETLSNVSMLREYQVQGQYVTFSHIDENEGAAAMRERHREVDVTVLAAYQQRGGASR